MKNKFITFFLVILFTLSNFSRVLGEEFIFEISDLEITENGNIYKGNNRGTIRTDSQLKLISDNFEYLKEINRLEANGDVQLIDLNNSITINAQQIFYLKNEEKIFTVGKTLIKISNKYNIEGFDLTLFKNKMILSSKKNSIITDSESNTYKLEQFQYSINQEILKGENIVAITSDKENKSDKTNGLFVQLPIPKHIDEKKMIEAISAEKDVDGLTERSMGRLMRGLPGHAPCTPLGVMRLLERYEIPTKGKKVVVIGRSTLTGLPQLVLFLRKGGDATTTCTHSHTSPEDLKAYCREADIIVSCVGIARLITADHVKPGATVIDVGVSREEAKIVGDVDFDSVQAVAGAITPMPGGTGPMTIGCLLENTLSAAKMLGAFPTK